MKSTCAVPEPLVDCPTVTLPPVALEEVMVKDFTVKFTKALVSKALTMPVESGGASYWIKFELLPVASGPTLCVAISPVTV